MHKAYVCAWGRWMFRRGIFGAPKVACALASAADARPQATFRDPYKASMEHPPLRGLHKEGCERLATIRHPPRKEIGFLCYCMVL